MSKCPLVDRISTISSLKTTCWGWSHSGPRGCPFPVMPELSGWWVRLYRTRGLLCFCFELWLSCAHLQICSAFLLPPLVCSGCSANSMAMCALQKPTLNTSTKVQALLGAFLVSVNMPITAFITAVQSSLLPWDSCRQGPEPALLSLVLEHRGASVIFELH